MNYNAFPTCVFSCGTWRKICDDFHLVAPHELLTLTYQAQDKENVIVLIRRNRRGSRGFLKLREVTR